MLLSGCVLHGSTSWALISETTLYLSFVFLARDAFVRTNSRAIAVMFVRLSVRLSVCLSVCLSGTCVHCGHTVHISADLGLRLDSPMFWAP